MNTITDISLLLYILINIGVGCRIVYCAVHIPLADETEQGEYKAKIKRCLWFLVFSVCIFSIKDMIVAYYR